MEITKIAPEIDALRQGMDWDSDDIARKQILIETSFGDSHPGSVHLDKLSEMAADGVKYLGGKPSSFTVTDICDGIAQGHDGMNYSLLSRDMIANMVEIHQKANNFDGMILISSCDKSIPAHLIAMARLNMPCVFIPGGTMPTASNGFTLEQIGSVNAGNKKGEITDSELCRYQSDACTSCGACQFMGTASTMQAMAEALGLALPHSAMIPANMKFALNKAKQSGKLIGSLIEKGIKTSDILTQKAFHNAAVIHGAIGGSTNALLHLPVIAMEAGVDFPVSRFDEIHRTVPFMVNTRPVGRFSTDMFWYAGGVAEIMLRLKDKLYLDALTITGKTVGENLEDIAEELALYKGYLANFRISPEEIITELSPRGAIAVLFGNIAKDGAVVKYTGLPSGMKHFKGRARVFNDELSARDAIINRSIKPGDCIVIRFCGPKGSGMPEMFYTTEALCADAELVASTAIITDGRFSGASKGPCIGHISPEAAEGGEIGLIKEFDEIEIDIENRRINAIGVDFESRRKEAQFIPKRQKGVLGLYQSLATSAMSGGYMKF